EPVRHGEVHQHRLELPGSLYQIHAVPPFCGRTPPATLSGPRGLVLPETVSRSVGARLSAAVVLKRRGTFSRCSPERRSSASSPCATRRRLGASTRGSSGSVSSKTHRSLSSSTPAARCCASPRCQNLPRSRSPSLAGGCPTSQRPHEAWPRGESASPA